MNAEDTETTRTSRARQSGLSSQTGQACDPQSLRQKLDLEPGVTSWRLPAATPGCGHRLGGLPCVNAQPHDGNGRGCVHHSGSAVPGRHQDD